MIKYDISIESDPSKIRKKLATNFTNDHELKILSSIFKNRININLFGQLKYIFYGVIKRLIKF